jgi:hypothetical protein
MELPAGGMRCSRLSHEPGSFTFRKYLFGAATTEGVSSVYGFFHWFALLFCR